jgi:N-acetylmuramoyl-L-alanine amidase
LESPYVKSYKIKNLFLSSGIKVTFTLDPSAGYEVTKDESGISVHFGERGNVKSAVSAPLASRRTSFNIVIDPGHGGEEEGAQGPGGTLEKDVTLSIAKLLAQRLRQDSGANVWLTRDDDRTLSLERRSELAVSKKADLFISIHANASRDKSASGIETYYLNNATDEAAARLAAFENRSTQKKLSEVEHIISTMLQNYDASESLDIATLVQSRLVNGLKSSDGKLKNRGVRSALFYVLVGAKCPAILVEAAFISNQKDENLLKEDKYQKDVAIAITDGVKKYLKVRDKALVSL